MLPDGTPSASSAVILVYMRYCAMSEEWVAFSSAPEGGTNPALPFISAAQVVRLLFSRGRRFDHPFHKRLIAGAFFVANAHMRYCAMSEEWVAFSSAL